MTHPKARTKPRPRAARRPADRIVITDKGCRLLALLDFIRGDIVRGYVRITNPEHEHGRATPCAPQREAPAAPANNNNKGGHVGCTPAHPAGKSDAAAIAPDKEPNP